MDWVGRVVDGTTGAQHPQGVPEGRLADDPDVAAAGGVAVRFGHRPDGIPAEPESAADASTRRSPTANPCWIASGTFRRSAASWPATTSSGEPETCCSTASPDQRARAMFTVTGREHLDAAFGLGRGCIVLASHFGAHLLPAHWLFRENFPVRFYMERPRHISRFMSRHFETDGPLGQDKLFISRQGVPADSASSILRAARAIKAGMLLYLAGDVRWTGRLTERPTSWAAPCDSRRPGSCWPR